MTRIKDITVHLERWAPTALAESYDNVGLLVGNPENEAKGVLVSLDCTEEVVEEAIARGCNMVVSHHPILFKGLKKLNGSNYVERVLIKAIQKDIALYAIHTNLDNVHTGVNQKIADQLGLTDTRILLPKQNLLQKLTFFVPRTHVQTVCEAVFAAGAGQIGNYAGCSFRLDGMGTFTPVEDAKPFIGKIGEPEHVEETRVEMMLPGHLAGAVIQALNEAHPYEEVAYYLSALNNKHQQIGSGMVGQLPSSMDFGDFFAHVKLQMQAKVIRHTKPLEGKVRRVALCGGSGSFLLQAAIAAKADVFVSADFKYHEFFDAEGNITIADIGHYETEHFTSDLIADKIREKFSTFATHLTQVNTNPIFYY